MSTMPMLVFLYFLASAMSNPSSRYNEPNHYHNGKHDSTYDHEAFLGSKKKAAEFRDLPSSVAKEKLRVLIKKVDKNQDGFVVKEELVSWLEVAFRNLSFHHGQKRIENADINKDRLVTWKEFFQLDWARHQERGLTDNEKKFVLEQYQLFKDLDVDGDELLTYEEIRALATPGEHKKMQDLTLRRIISSSDTNQDWKLNVSEYMNNKELNPGRPNQPHIVEEFEKRDLNGDQALDITELTSALFPTESDKAKKEANHLIEEVDVNKDGKLSYEEVLQNYSVFVGHRSIYFKDEL